MGFFSRIRLRASRSSPSERACEACEDSGQALALTRSWNAARSSADLRACCGHDSGRCSPDSNLPCEPLDFLLADVGAPAAGEPDRPELAHKPAGSGLCEAELLLELLAGSQ